MRTSFDSWRLRGFQGRIAGEYPGVHEVFPSERSRSIYRDRRVPSLMTISSFTDHLNGAAAWNTAICRWKRNWSRATGASHSNSAAHRHAWTLYSHSRHGWRSDPQCARYSDMYLQATLLAIEFVSFSLRKLTYINLKSNKFRRLWAVHFRESSRHSLKAWSVVQMLPTSEFFIKSQNDSYAWLRWISVLSPNYQVAQVSFFSVKEDLVVCEQPRYTPFIFPSYSSVPA